MKISNLLYVALCSTVVLSACSSSEEKLVLGSRDDIIIMKNGIPVDGSITVMAEAQTAPDAMQPMVPEMEETIEESTEELAEIKEDAVEEAVEVAEVITPVKAETPIRAEEAVTASVQEEIEEIETTVVSSVQKTEAKAAKAMMTPKGLNVEDTANESVEKIAEKTTSVVTTEQPEDMQPVKEITMNKVEEEVKKSPVVETVTEEAASIDVIASEPAPVLMNETPMEEKPEQVVTEMIDGCFKTVIIPSTPGNVSPVPVMEKRQIVCQKDITPSMVAILQKALMNKGYNIGTPDGRLGNKTFNALEDYQRKNGLGIGGITFETLEHLKIK